jgi:HlyD family secretion protein
MNISLPKSRWWWAAAIGAVIALALASWLASRGVAADAVAARSGPLVRTLQFSARVATLSRVDIGSTLTGRVAQVMVREGDQVKAGAPLVRMEQDEHQAALAQAQAAERQAEARLAGLRSTGRMSARALLEQAQATLVAAQAELARVQQLVAQGFVSASRVDDARRAVEVAQAQRQAAAAQSQANAERGTELVQAQAQLNAARAATAAARARLTQTTLLAPADARVLSRDVEPGQIVQPGRALIGLAFKGPTQIVAQVDERFLDQLQTGQSATVVADAFAQQRLAAKLLSIAPGVDAQRGAVEVKFALDQPPPAYLREDMTLSVEVETGKRERALVLPGRALRSPTGAADSVLVVEDGRAVERKVRIGLRTLEAVEVLEGVREGEQVLLAPALLAGSRVRARVIEWQPARSPGAAAAAAGDPMSGLTNAMGR